MVNKDDKLMLNKNIKKFDSNMIDLIEIINFSHNSINSHLSNNSDIFHKEVVDPFLLFQRIQNETNLETKRQLEQKLKEDFPEFQKDNSEIKGYNKDENSTELLLRGNHSQIFNKSYNELLKTGNKYKFLYSSSVVSLISTVEVFFSQLLHSYLIKHPFYAIKEKQIRIKEIFKNDEGFASFNIKDISSVNNNINIEVFNSIIVSTDNIISDYIEVFIRGGFNKWIKEISSLCIKLSLNKDLIDFSNEIFQRRHLIIHNNSRVDNKYLDSVDEKYRIGCVLGKEIKTDYNYITKAIDTLEFVFLLLSIAFCEKLEYSHYNIFSVLTNIAYDNLIHKRWGFVTLLSDYIYTKQTEHNNIRLMAYSALIFSSMKLGKELVINNEEYSGTELRFQLYFNALTDDHENFLKNLKKMKNKRDIVREILAYPIFEKILEIEKIKKYIDSITFDEPTKTKIVPLF